ncbi:MAG: TetR/AcrR family transcriptional regulator [Herbinix sp.]|jgi:AcrR family transcriptional regulator|nr:TetR/AcrR family transcriptional regulator [Herbinix sp.]
MDHMNDVKSDRRIRKTKKALKDGLTKLMLEKSIKDISVKELTEEVDINRGTFYLHYKDVFDMVEQIEKEMLHEFTEVMSYHTLQSLNGQPLPLLIDIFSFLKENATMCAALLGSHGDIAFVNKLKEVVREKCLNVWMELFHNGKVERFEYFYSFIFSGCIGLFEIWLKNGLKESPEQIAKLTEEMILHGVEAIR